MKIYSAYIVLMTKNIPSQLKFYKDTLELKIIFESENAIGLGLQDQLYLILRKDSEPQSHHDSKYKGPIILTFKFSSKNQPQLMQRIKNEGYVRRGSTLLPEYQSEYHFIEDADGNEICLHFQENSDSI